MTFGRNSSSAKPKGNMTKEQEILQMANRIRELWPGLTKITLEVMKESVELDFYRLSNYHEGTALLRELSVGDRDKQVYDPERDPWCIIRGSTPQGLLVVAFCGGLPPTCHVEEYVEKVPIYETITKDEFVEVKRKKVVCG